MIAAKAEVYDTLQHSHPNALYEFLLKTPSTNFCFICTTPDQAKFKAVDTTQFLEPPIT